MSTTLLLHRQERRFGEEKAAVHIPVGPGPDPASPSLSLSVALCWLEVSSFLGKNRENNHFVGQTSSWGQLCSLVDLLCQFPSFQYLRV